MSNNQGQTVEAGCAPAYVLPVKNSLAAYTAEEIDQYLDANPPAQVPNSEHPDRGDYLTILANSADRLSKKAFSDAITMHPLAHRSHVHVSAPA
jgi:hypothetical protein